MTRHEFWHIIDQTPPEYNARLDALTERFSRLPTEAMFEFYHQYVGVLVEALRPELRAATGVITDFWESWSDERFNYFVYCLILRGRRPFEAALADPETLADVLGPDAGGVLPEGLDLLHLVDEAYRDRTGRNDPGAVRRPRGGGLGECGGTGAAVPAAVRPGQGRPGRTRRCTGPRRPVGFPHSSPCGRGGGEGSVGGRGFWGTGQMGVLRTVSRLTPHEEPMDAWLSKWGSVAGGLLVVALTVAVLPAQAANRAELWLGIGMASVACSNLFLFGVLSRRVHLAWHRGAVPWRVRRGEFLGTGAALGLVGAGTWRIATLQLTPSGMIVGGLVVVSMAIATLCLGLWSTLAGAADPGGAADRTGIG